MTRRMSVSFTLDAVRARTKTVTRRRIDTWRDLEAGDRLTLIEKGMGLPKGAKQVVVTEVEIVDVRVEPLYDIDEDDVIAEGFEGMLPGEFCSMWMDAHGYGGITAQHEAMAIQCRRIEWCYLDGGSAASATAPLGEQPVEDRVGGQVQDEVLGEVSHQSFPQLIRTVGQDEVR